METRKNYWGTYSGQELEALKAEEKREKETQETVNKMRNYAHRQCKERGIDTRVFDQYAIDEEFVHPVLWSRLNAEQKSFVSNLAGRFTSKVMEICN